MVDDALTPRYLQLPSRALGRRVHLWCYGHWGVPVLALPSAGGYAHEWAHQGMIDALAPLLRAGRIKLYCPETNVSRTWADIDGDPAWRMARHEAYERFAAAELVDFIERDCDTPGIPVALAGCSLGALYAVNLALKHPRRFRWALGMSGRYQTAPFLPGYAGLDAYYSNPMAFAPGLSGEALWQIRASTSITLVCGQGAFEGRCLPETRALAGILQGLGIACELDLWGHDVSHQWPWWARQASYHLGRYARAAKRSAG